MYHAAVSRISHTGAGQSSHLQGFTKFGDESSLL